MISSNRTIRARATDQGAPPHPEIRLSFDADAVIEPDVAWLENVLSEQIARGARYLSGQTIVLGWLLFKVLDEADHLVLSEPDYSGVVPMQFVPSITRSLVHLRFQKSVVESVRLSDEADYPSPLQACLVCPRIDDRAQFTMERFENTGRNSGWYLGCNDPDHNHNDTINLAKSLYEVACYRPECIPFLALPTGSMARISDEQIVIRFGSKEIIPEPASFLGRYLAQARSGKKGNE